ncbi:MAG: hypothetical protein Ct9H90mP16_03590 [Candidatus Poseidoniales archaeon]|nr:MAG: hypothetical protein Ct9H90mP16_03590 [Candidatus Poseidoniales archaeon]
MFRVSRKCGWVIAVGAVDINGDLWERTATGQKRKVPMGPFENPQSKARSFRTRSRHHLNSDSTYSIPYSSSTGTSDSTVFVTGALALILERHGAALDTLDDPEQVICW